MNTDKLLDNIFALIKTFLIILLYTIVLPILLYQIKTSGINLILKSLITSIIMFLLFKDKLIKDAKTFKKEYITKNYQYYILGFLGMILCNTIISAVMPGIPMNESLNRTLLQSYPFAFVISAVILGPINEELVFRANFDLIKNKNIFIIFTSTLFALLHAINGITKIIHLIYFLPYFILAISFAYLYRKTDNIYTSIFFHICHNVITVLQIFLI